MSFADKDPYGRAACKEISAKGAELSKAAEGPTFHMITDSQLSAIITILAIHQYVEAAKELAILPELEDNFVLRDP